MDIWSIIVQWQQQEQPHNPVNQQQSQYLQNLIEQAKIKNIEQWITEKLDREISTIDDVKSNEMSILIKILKSNITINTLQLLKLQQMFPMQNLNYYKKMVGRDINGLDELTVYEYNNLLTRQSKFTMRSIDIILKHTDDYEYGYQFSSLCENNKLYYIRFNNLMMLDYDAGEAETLEDVEKYLHMSMHDYFAIYKTYNGYHIFVLSRQINYKDPYCYQYMLDIGSDPYYALFVKNNAFKIRLSKKNNRNEEYVAKFIKYYGNSQLCCPYLVELLKIYDSYNNSHN